MSDTLTTLDIPATLHRTATIDAPPPLGGTRATEDGPTEYRVRIALSSDKPYRRWFGDEILGHSAGEIDASRLAAGAPALIDHDNRTDSVVGRLENHSIDADGVLRADVVFDPEHEPALRLYQRIARGFVKDVSVGYSVSRWQVTERDGGVDEYRAIRWTPMEASFVAVPADASVGANREAGGTALVSVPVTRALAPAAETARSANMSEQLTPAAPAPSPAIAPAPVVSREQELAELAHITNRSADLAAWIMSGRSVAEVRAAIMAEQRAAQAAPTSPTAPVIGVGADREAEKPFGTLAEQLVAIKRAASGDVDKRLLHLTRGTPTGMGELVGADGGFLLQPQFSSEIFRLSFDGGAILSRVDQIPVSGNQYVMNAINETSRVNGSRSGGVQGFWAGENDTVTATRPRFRRITLDLSKKIVALGYATEEQLEDAPATSQILQRAFADEITFVAEQAIWAGSGSGQPLGFMNSGALVTQAAEGGQTADTIVAANITKMWSRLLPAARANAVWFINQDAEPQLPLMTIGNWPIYSPPGGLSGGQYGTLYNRPVIAVEFASTIGDVGDIVLADLSMYALGVKAAGTQMARSIHVRFINGEETFRATMRLDGQPKLAQPVTPLNGSNTQSFAVALAAR